MVTQTRTFVRGEAGFPLLRLARRRLDVPHRSETRCPRDRRRRPTHHSFEGLELPDGAHGAVARTRRRGPGGRTGTQSRQPHHLVQPPPTWRTFRGLSPESAPSSGRCRFPRPHQGQPAPGTSTVTARMRPSRTLAASPGSEVDAEHTNSVRRSTPPSMHAYAWNGAVDTRWVIRPPSSTRTTSSSKIVDDH